MEGQLRSDSQEGARACCALTLSATVELQSNGGPARQHQHLCLARRLGASRHAAVDALLSPVATAAGGAAVRCSAAVLSRHCCCHGRQASNAVLLTGHTQMPSTTAAHPQCADHVPMA